MVVWWYEAMGCEETDNQCHDRWDEIHIAAIVPSAISLGCSFYIIIMTIIYKKQFKKITFGATLPAYISICDTIFHGCHGSDHLHNLIKGYVTPGGWCQFLGCMKPFSINCQTSWALGTAIFINYCVRHEHPPQKDYPRFNYMLHGLCWGIPTMILIFGFSFDVYGVEGPWCGVVAPLNDLLMVDLWVVVVDILLFLLYSWTALYIYNKMKSVWAISKGKSVDCDHDDQETQKINRAAKKIKKIMRTLPWFPVIFICQWFWYLSWKLYLARTFWQSMMVVTITNMGGMFNAIVFYRLLMNPVRRQRRNQELQMATIHQKNIKADKSATSNATSDSTSTKLKAKSTVTETV